MNEIVGDWLRSKRVEYGLTLDQIATTSRKYESGWTSATLSHMEKGGSKADALPTLMVLLATLNDLTGGEFKLADIFTDYGGDVVVTKGYSTSYENVSSALHDEPVSFKRTNVDMLERIRHEREEENALFSADDPEYAALVGDVAARLGDDAVEVGLHMFIAPSHAPVFHLSQRYFDSEIVANHFPTMAEARLETRLSEANEDFKRQMDYSEPETPEGFYVAAICDVLYGHSLDEEAAKRAGEGATPQKRGRVTRVLADEILDYMRKVAAKLKD
ncbi:MAG: helix-turn-helix transcriptional regulator [Bifidobacterium pseudolongum]|nr:helix-turn-helix transcriptional regulator [Bifidobacterium pseudolongum]